MITDIFPGLSKDPDPENKTPSELIFLTISLTLPLNFKCMRWSFREKKSRIRQNNIHVDFLKIEILM